MIECKRFIPAEYQEPVKGVSILPLGSTVGDLGKALDGQTSKLELANSHTAGAIQITAECDKRNKEILDKLYPSKKKWW
jgi:hypothetical protein